MIYKVFAVYDNKVGAYLPPLFFRSKGEAIRAFSSAVGDGKHQFAQHPADYLLCELGEWDDGSAAFSSSLAVPAVPVISGLEAVSRDT